VGNSVAELAPQTLQARCVNGLDCWITRTYYELRRAGFDATIGPSLSPSAVNIAGVRHFGRRQRDIGSFVVIPRLDGHDPKLANFTIYQNGLKQGAPDTGHVNHWLQPNIMPRDPVRGTEVKAIAYKGAVINLDPQFRSQAFRDALAEMDVALVLDAIEGNADTQSWGDYRSIDAILAVRNLTRYDAMYKPASKLINAWWGDVPALLGPEPAFKEVQRSELDFIDITSARDVLDAVARLKAEPKLYSAMVENGRMRRDAYSVETTLNSWVNLFEGEIARSYARWQGTSGLHKAVRYAVGMLREPSSKRSHQVQSLNGTRILPEH
jgi:hypothetical protein